MRLQGLAALLCSVTLLGAPASSKDSVQSVLTRMDKAASEFKTMTANVTYVTHTDVINEDSTETGVVAMEKVRAGEVRSLIEFRPPDQRTIEFAKRQLRIYYPKIKTVQEWNLDKHGEQLDQFLMIGFGTSGTTLAKDYTVDVLGIETVKSLEGVQSIRVRLVPKSSEAKQYVTQFELWIPENGDPYPLQEKISAPSGDYRLITYKDMKINTPLKRDALQLKLPSGVNREYPGK